MLNRIIITGRIVADPELRNTNNGIFVTSLRIACDRDFKNNGNKESDFFDIVAWRSTAEFVCKYFRKGSLISIDGRLQTRHYTDKNNNNRVAVEICADHAYFGDSKKDGNDGNTAVAPGGQAGYMPDDDFVPEFFDDDSNGFDQIVEEDNSFPSFPG